MNPPLSAVIITFNEEKNIERCILSVKELVDEIVVVDSFSSDNTRNICEKYNVRFLQIPFAGHIEQKNYALSVAGNDWVLSLDADEALDITLFSEIQNADRTSQEVAYSMNRLTSYCGKWIRYGSWYPDRKVRLFNRKTAHWAGINPHDKVETGKNVALKHLNGDILHYSYYSIEQHMLQLDKFSSIAAKAYLNQNKSAGFFNIVVNPPFAFFRDYFLRLGFLDGFEGFIIARFTAYYVLQKYVKLRLLKKGTQI
jgi:glycosyltransferase involved in cell wall biosynthesis